MRIAIVDDLTTESNHLQEMLTQQFHETHTDIHRLDIYSSAEALLEKWEPNAYDLVLLDIYMDGMTGVELAHILRRSDEHVRLVFCTTSYEFASESYAVGASYYLHKPYADADIRRMITQTKGEKKLLICGQTQGNKLLFTIDNTFDRPVRKDLSGIFLSSKHVGHGIGIESAKAIVLRHNGQLRIEQNDGMFCVSLLIDL